MRRQISITCAAIDTAVTDRGSRRAIQAMVDKAVDLLSRTDVLNTILTDAEIDQADFGHQHEQQLRFLTLVEDSRTRAETYLAERQDDPASVLEQPIDLVAARRGAERQQQIQAAQRRADAVRREAEEAQQRLEELTATSSHSGASH